MNGEQVTLRQAQPLVDLASVGGLFLAICLGLVMAFDHPSVVFLAFLFMMGVAPPVSAAALYWNEKSGAAGPRALAALRLWIKVPLLWLLLVLLAYVLLVVLDGSAAVRQRETAIRSIAIAAAVVLAVRLTAGRRRFPGALDGSLIATLALAVFALSPFSPYAAVPIGLLDYALAAPRFWLWLLVGAAWTAAGIWLRRREGWAFAGMRRTLEAVAICVAGVVVLLLYDDSHFTDFSHYMPLVGPALHAARGGTPMVDVYSVYGLGPWLIHRAAFELFMPSFGTAAVTVRVINLLYYARSRRCSCWSHWRAERLALHSRDPRR